MLVNKIGVCSMLALMAIYLGFEIKKYTLDMILNVLILVLGTLVIQKGLYVIVEDFEIVGKICIGTKIITFFNPMSLLYQVYKEKNFGYISMKNTFLYAFVSLAWAIFGKSSHDFNVIMANAIAFVLCKTFEEDIMKQKVSLTLDDDIIEALKRRAREEGRSVSNLVEHLLKRRFLPNLKQQEDRKEPLD